MVPSLDPAAGPRALRALAAARALDVDGQYNAAKLFRAAALGHAVRATREPVRPGAARLQALAAVIAEWRAVRGADALADAMERAMAAIAAGRPWVTLEEAPCTFVCRVCGEVVLAVPPARCPECGARGMTFQEVLGTYFLLPLAVDRLLAALAATPTEVGRLCTGIGEEAADRGAWPPREIVAHLLAAEQVMGGRAWRMLAETEPRLTSTAPPTADAAARSRSFAELITAFAAGRQQTLARLRALAPEAWERTGVHPEWGRVTVRQQLSYVAWHEQSHLADLEASCRVARGEGTGAQA